MKKFLFSLILLLVSYIGFSQKGLSYQAVILDPNKIEVPGQDISGQPLVNGEVWMKFSIYNGSTLQFEEVQKTKTDNYGLVNLLIGSVSSASFNSLVWDSSQKSLYVYASFDQGGSYTKISEQKLTYNPYALYAETAGKLGATLPISGGGTGATTAADARANLGLDQVNNTSDVAKPVSAATQTALDLKANNADVTAGLALKANTVDVTAALASKANVADMTTALAAKADTASIKSFVMTQVSTATISDADPNTKGKIQLAGDLAGTAAAPTVPGLALKANTADVTSALALKADTTYVVAKVAAATIADADASTKGKIQLAGDLGGTAAAPTVPGLALKLDASQKGAANGVATLNAFGIIPSSQLPAVTISSTSVVRSDSAMTALSNATVGSIAVRTDANKNFVLSALPASTLANWVELLTPAAPVQAVNGYTGSINLTKSDVGLGNVDNTPDANKLVSNPTQAALNLKLDVNKLGSANGAASLNALGKIPTDQIPAISFSSVKVLESQAEMLALNSAVVGSVVIRTDVNKNYVLAQANPNLLANWIELLTPAPPVQTVNGYTGSVSISKSDVGLANAENTSDANKPVSSATQTALDLKANAASLAAVATTGNYNDLLNLPTTTAVDASTLSGTLAISSGGTGSTTKNFIDLSTDQTITGAKVFTTNGTYAAALTVSGNLVAPNIGSSSVVDFTHRIVSAATSSTFTKLIQLGTGGLSGSNTILNIGSGLSGANNAITIGGPAAASTTRTTINGAVVLPTLSGYVKGNGADALTASATIPSSDITGLIKKVNGNLPDVDGNVAISFGTVTTGTLANRPVNMGTNGNIYVVSADPNTSDNGRTYISDGTNWNEVTSNQAATDARYVQLASQITANLTGNVTGDVSGNVSGTASNVTGLVSVANGGTGATSLTGYLKGNGTTAVSASATIPATDITGLIKKVNGSVPDADGNVAISFGTVFTGTLANRPINAGTNGNIYVVSSDATTAENGRTFISDGTSWKEVTSNQSATDARYLKLAGGTLSGNLVVPSSTKITLTDAPVLNTDAVNKAYVDGLSSTVGGSTSTLLHSAEIAANAATASNTANQIVKRDGNGSFSATTITANLLGNASNVTGIVLGANGGTGVANTGKSITLGGDFSTGHTLAFTTSGSTTLTLPTSGTLATLQQIDAKELISNKSTDVTLGAANNPTSLGDTKFPTQNAVKAYVTSALSTVASPLNGYTITPTNGNSNVGLGLGVASSSTGSNNTNLGTLSLAHVTSGDFNVIVGAQAARYISRTFGDWATNNQSMNKSVFIGSMTRASNNNATNEIVIGYEAVGSGSNTIQLGNTAVTDVKTNGKLTSGTVTYPNAHGTAGQVLSTTGSSALAWASVVDATSNQTIAGLKTFSNKVTLNSGTAGGASLEVNGASTNTAAFNAASGTSIDFTKSNLAYTSANAGAFTLTGMKDGGTYTLAVQGTTSGTAAFTQTGLTFTSINNAATTASKHTLYTFIVMGMTVYYSMMTGL